MSTQRNICCKTKTDVSNTCQIIIHKPHFWRHVYCIKNGEINISFNTEEFGNLCKIPSYGIIYKINARDPSLNFDHFVAMTRFLINPMRDNKFILKEKFMKNKMSYHASYCNPSSTSKKRKTWWAPKRKYSIYVTVNSKLSS